MAQAEFQDTLAVDKDKLFDVIVRYEDYPQFVDGCTAVKVERKAPGHARVTYHVSMMKDIVYTIDLTEDREAGTVKWHLVEGDIFKINNGTWELKAAGPGKTDARYAVEIDFKISVPSLILNRLVKGNLPGMVKSFEKKSKGAVMAEDIQSKAADLVKRVLTVGVGAIFLTEESLRSLVSELKLPKELLTGVLASAGKTKNEFLTKLSSDIMEKVTTRIDPSALVEEILEKNEIEFTVRMSFKPKEKK